MIKRLWFSIFLLCCCIGMEIYFVVDLAIRILAHTCRPNDIFSAIMGAVALVFCGYSLKFAHELQIIKDKERAERSE